MKYLRLTLDLPGDVIHPMHAFVCEHGDYADYRLIHWNYDGPDANTLLFHVRGDREPYAERLADLDRVQSFELAPITDDAFYVYVEESPADVDASLLDVFAEHSVLAVPPVAYHTDRTMSLGVVGDPDVLRAVLDGVPDVIDVTVDQVGDDPPADPEVGVDLTTRQRDAVRAAQRMGYYEVPRDAGVDDVADAIDCAPGTAAEHLRRAESRILGDLDV
ncbi:helix-turn-helix domain-containing protein [Halorubellus litoreus]|uniref:Helix-turn-helix domain-containing protein n=1 Tax=Halorubellus litoreus TaxID=755308 RepID=A0ABD5V970_9EURY